MRIIFIFRRDLRIQDNPALAAALQHCHESGAEFYPCFFFDSRQISPTANPYYSANAVAFMFECLAELDRDLRAAGLGQLHCFATRSDTIPSAVRQGTTILATYFNRDVTPFALRRDGTPRDHPDIGLGYLLASSVHEIKTLAGNPYAMFTPFYNRASRMRIPTPTRAPRVAAGIRIVRDSHRLADFRPPANTVKDIQGGRQAALRILGRLRTGFTHYLTTRDDPSNSQGTTRLSAYLKFGTVSVREVYHATRNSDLRRELFWREFYFNVAFHFPHVLRGQVGAPNQAMYPIYNSVPWARTPRIAFARWSRGQTGFPFVDAGMRQLLATGWMHNRLRMITASFLTKDLHIDWRLGERFFATHLTDYDPSQNNGGWQWCASTGADAQPYFRVFNPWEQSRRYDPNAIYIKRWCPELATLTPREIHNWHLLYEAHPTVDYPAPMCDHHAEAQRTIAYYRRL